MTEEFSLLSYLNVTVPDKVPLPQPSGRKVGSSAAKAPSAATSTSGALSKRIFTPKRKPPSSRTSLASDSEYNVGGRGSRSSSSVSSIVGAQKKSSPKQRANPHYETTYGRTFSSSKYTQPAANARNEDVQSVVRDMQDMFSAVEQQHFDPQAASSRVLPPQVDIDHFEEEGAIPATPSARNQEPHPTPSQTQHMGHPSDESEGGAVDPRAPFMSPAHKRRQQEVPTATFLAQSMGAPHEVRVSEVRVSQPGRDPIIYEVHDLELPPSAEELNAENERLKREKSQLEQQEDALYGSLMQKSNQEYFREQRELLEDRKRKHMEDYEEWKNQVRERRERDMEEQNIEENELRQQMELQNERARQQHEAALRDKQRERDQYAHDLEEQIREKDRQRREDREFDLEAPPGPDVDQANLEQMQERLGRRRELIDYWNQQLDAKERLEHEEKERDRQMFNQALNRDMRELQNEMDQSRREREALREDLRGEWKRSVDEKQRERALEEDEKARDRDARRRQEHQMLQDQQRLIEERARRIEERKKALDEQMQTLNKYREEDKLRDESMEQEMLRKIREGLMRRKLYRDIRTKKILSSKEAKRLVPTH
uniref:Uncharacterized protein n=1 Tax=Percolomonas cosmopolitus TaxID=63605 RepID=A0A7S1KR78_9EUKA